MTDRRGQDRGTGDRRSEKRRDLPLWAYFIAVAAIAVLMFGFWSLIY